MQGDFPVKVSTQLVTFRDTGTLTVAVPTYVSDAWYVGGLPRQFISVNQTAGALAASVLVEWAIRDSGTVGLPEWLKLQTITLVVGGATPVNTVLVTGAIWLRFSLTGANGDSAEFAGTAFL